MLVILVVHLVRMKDKLLVGIIHAFIVKMIVLYKHVQIQIVVTIYILIILIIHAQK